MIGIDEAEQMAIGRQLVVRQEQAVVVA